MWLRKSAVRRSGIHGKGLFARRRIVAGAKLMRYRGQVIDWETAGERYATSDADEGHTFYFDLGDGRVIDGGRGGNSSRWINHGCDPNIEAVVDGAKVTFHALRDIAPGEELLLDYRLELDASAQDEEYDWYVCRCDAPDCRQTMLAT
jgi:SET domain-containing protein